MEKLENNKAVLSQRDLRTAFYFLGGIRTKDRFFPFLFENRGRSSLNTIPLLFKPISFVWGKAGILILHHSFILNILKKVLYYSLQVIVFKISFV